MTNICSPKLTRTIITLTLLFSITFTKSQEFSRNISKEELNLKKQKLSHLHFYFHDIVSGRHPTTARIASAQVTNTSTTGFGFLVMIDDPLTIGPEPNSTIVGRAQGIYGSADLTNIGLLMVLNYYFTEGKFNGSTLSILGRNPVFNVVREMPIVGGSGVFRFASGYAQARTHSLDLKSGDAVVESKITNETHKNLKNGYSRGLRRGNLHHDPTIKPGLGSARCPRCLSLLNLTQENSEWKITPVLHGATAVAGSGLGGMLSAVHGFNTGIPYVQKYFKRRKWLPFVLGVPPLLMFSAASAVFGGYALPEFTQLTVTSYYAASSASHYAISLLTRHIEEDHFSRIQHEELG